MPSIRYANTPSDSTRQETISGCRSENGRLYVNLTLNIASPDSIEDLREQLAASPDAVRAVAEHLSLGSERYASEDDDTDVPDSDFAVAKSAMETLQSFFSGDDN